MKVKCPVIEDLLPLFIDEVCSEESRIIVAIPMLFLASIEVIGDGLGFSALYGRYMTERFLSKVESGEFLSATRYMAFPAEKMENEDEDEARIEWVRGMQDLKSENIEIISHEKNAIITDDTFTSGYVKVAVRYRVAIYDFELYISTNNGKVEPMELRLDSSGPHRQPTEVEIMLIEKITNIISTYNPG